MSQFDFAVIFSTAVLVLPAVLLGLAVKFCGLADERQQFSRDSDGARRVTLAECPVGLFFSDRELCLKTEYGNNEGRIDAYIVSSGEFFWGSHPQTIPNQRAQMVTPIDTDAAIAALSTPVSPTNEAARIAEGVRGRLEAIVGWLQRKGFEATSDELRLLEADLTEQIAALSTPVSLSHLLRAGTVSLTSFDGPCVRIDFETREEAEALLAAVTLEGGPHG